jgi:predicted peptidase
MPVVFRLTFPILLGSIALLIPTEIKAQAPPAKVEESLRAELAELQRLLAEETKKREAAAEKSGTGEDRQSLADAAVFPKAVEWILRHQEFYKPNYVEQTRQVLKLGKDRVQNLSQEKTPWQNRPGSTVLGYFSKVDGSVQPYALALPEGVDPKSGTRWPLYVKLHGRAATMNEVNFISKYEDKPLPQDQTWIQLDVFGRTNNAFRFAGETDVFEAIADVKRRYRIDDKRITLWGFSMGGAGAWHLGMHHPSAWASVGAGAGFVDFYGYQKQKQKLPAYQDQTLKIYDAVDYAMNAANVPFITYGGEIDPQLAASTTMIAAAKKDNVDIPLIVGKGSASSIAGTLEKPV